MRQRGSHSINSHPPLRCVCVVVDVTREIVQLVQVHVLDVEARDIMLIIALPVDLLKSLRLGQAMVEPVA